MEGTTSIGQLPTDGNFTQNINMNIDPQQQHISNAQGQPQMSISQGAMQGQPQGQIPMQMGGQQNNVLTDQMRPVSPPPQAIPNMGGNSGGQPVFINNGASTNNDAGLVQHLNRIHETNMMNNGSMELPSRDMPRGTFNMATDAETQQNYISQQQQPYINNPMNINTLNGINRAINSIAGSNDAIYEELKLPIIVTLLYMISLTDAVTNSFKTTFPFFFDDKDMLKKTGLVTKSIMFGGLFLACNKVIQHFSNL